MSSPGPPTERAEASGVGAHRRRLRLRALLVGVLGVVLLIAAGVWALRDLPRRRVQAGLAERLGAEVRLGGFEVQGLQKVLLRNLLVRRMDGKPWLDSVRIGTLVATGRLSAMLDGRFETLHASDMEARIVPPRGEPEASAAGPPVTFAAGSIEIERGALLVAANGSESRLLVTADLRGVGESTSGQIHLIGNGPTQLAPVLAFVSSSTATHPVPPDEGARGPGSAGPLSGTASGFRPGVLAADAGSKTGAGTAIDGAIEAFEATVTIAEGGRKIDVAAGGSRLDVKRGAAVLALPGPTLTASVRQPEAGEPIHIEAHPKSSLFGAASLSADLDPASFALIRGFARLEGVKLHPLLGVLWSPPFLRDLQGEADLVIAADRPGHAEYSLHARAPVLALEGGALSASLEGAVLEVAGEVFRHEGAASASARGTLEIPAGSGTVNGRSMPAELLPAHASLDGTISISPSLEIAGTVQIESAAVGEIEARGSAGWQGLAGTPDEGAGRAAAPHGAAQGQGRGTGAAPASQPGQVSPSVRVKWLWKHAEVERLTALIRGIGLAIPDTIQAAGTIEGEGMLDGPLSAPSLRGSIAGTRLRAAYEGGGSGPARTVASASVTAQTLAKSSTAAVPPASASPSTAGPPSRQNSFTLQDARAHADLLWRTSEGSVYISGLQIEGTARLGPLEAVPVKMTASGRISPLRAEAQLDAGLLETPGLARVSAQGTADLDVLSTARLPARAAAGPSSSQPAASFTLRVEGADVSRWQSYLLPWIGDPAPGYRVKGTASADLTGTLGADGVWALAGKAAVVKNGLASDDGSQVLEGFDTSWDLNVDGKIATGAAKIEAKAAVGGFQLLWGSFFADVSNLGSTIELSANIAAPTPTGNAPEGTRGAPVQGGEGPAHGSTDGAATHPTWSTHVAWSFPSGPHAEATVQNAPGSSLAYTLSTDVADIGETVTRYLRTPLGDAVPFLAKIEAAGSLHANVSGVLSETVRSLSGRMKVERLRLAGTQGYAEVRGLDLDLPVDLRWTRVAAGAAHGARARSEAVRSDRAGPQTVAWSSPSGSPEESGTEAARTAIGAGGETQAASATESVGARAGEADSALGWSGPTGAELVGRLRFESLTVGGLTIPSLATGLRIRADSVGLEEGLAVPVFGGVLVFEDLSLDDLLRQGRRLESAILLSHLGIAEATKAFELSPLEGEMNGYFPRVHLTPASLKVDGGGRLDLFGGTIALGEVRGEEILSRFPRIGFSADLEDIDLGQVTHRFDFGEVTGILRGYVHDCELFRGIPVRFEGLFETVERKGVPRRINVKAINNLAILGTGGGVNIFDRGIHKFLDSYTYDRLGVKMTLRNDVFLLEGLIHEHGRELFLKGRLPFPINVVNGQPGTPVSFRTMVERVKSIDFSTVQTGR